MFEMETFHRAAPGHEAAAAFLCALACMGLLELATRIEIVLEAEADFDVLSDAETTLASDLNLGSIAQPRCEAIWTRTLAANGGSRLTFTAYDHRGAALLRVTRSLPSTSGELVVR